MSVLVLLEALVKPKEISSMKSYLAEILPASRAFDGCQAFDVYFNTENESQLVVIERWEPRPDHEKYPGWRTETGVMQKIGGMLAGAPSIRFFERSNM